MNIHIIRVGKIKEKYIKLGIAEFEKRLQPYCKLSFSEVIDEKAPEQLSDKDLSRVKIKEGERILGRIKPDHFVIALDVKGAEYTSEQFSNELQNVGFQGKSNITFIIGGSNG